MADGFEYTFPFDFYVPPKYRRPLVLEVRTADGEMVRILPRFYGAAMQTAINEPGELQFAVLKSDEAGDMLSGDNQIWIRDGDDNIMAQYRIARREETSAVDGSEVRVICRGLLADLACEPLDQYSATATINQHLATWFAGQQGLYPLTIGTIDSTVGTRTRTLDFRDQTTILGAINALEKTLVTDTMFYVNTAREFCWLPLSSLANRGYQLRLGRNVESLERVIDYDAQATRIYARGKNVEGQYVRISQAAGSTVNYVQSTLTAKKYRRQITIPPSDDRPLGATNYTFYYRLASDTHLAEHAASNGSDIGFLASADGQTNLTSSVIEYDSATGALFASVVIPSVSAVYDTVIYMVYGV